MYNFLKTFFMVLQTMLRNARALCDPWGEKPSVPLSGFLRRHLSLVPLFTKYPW